MVNKVSNIINFDESSVDVLSDVLDTLRFRGSIFFRSELAAPWGMSLSKLHNPRFHIALSGSCYVGIDNVSKDVVNIKHMDIVMLPHGEAHWIADQPNRTLTPSQQAGDACELGMPLFQGGEITNKLICGLIDYDKGMVHPIIDSLPHSMHFSNIAHDDPIWMTVLLIDAEMEAKQVSQASIIDRLTEVLVMQLLTQHIAESKETTGFFAALHDKRIYRVLALIHQAPGHDWTLDLLAEQANMSPATLTRQFNAAVGMAPITYLSSWRMTKACNLLKHTKNTVTMIADEVGFSSAKTFTKAFKREYGKTPNALRKNLA